MPKKIYSYMYNISVDNRHRYLRCSRTGQRPIWLDYSLGDKDREWRWPRSGKPIDQAGKLPTGTLGASNEPRRQVPACMLY